MITARGITERIPKTFAMMAPDPDDPVYSVQLYGTDPAVIAKAITIACGEYGVQHIDLNFGCPVPKVTRRGGGGVLAWKLDRFEQILAQAVRAAEPYSVPVTIKTRIGIDDDHITMFDAGRIAEASGIAAITLHARTVDQAYAGKARWEAIGELVQAVSIPVIGNGDIWEAADALRMVAETGCAGVSIGRGVLGRPWLFRDLAAAFNPDPPIHRCYASLDRRAGGVDNARQASSLPSTLSPCHHTYLAPLATRAIGGSGFDPASSAITTLPTAGEVAAMVRRHAELLIAHFGSERHGLADLRKHMAWYFKGFSLGGDLRYALGLVTSLTQLDDLLAQVNPDEPFPRHALHAPRGRQGSPRTKVTMPYGWLDSRFLDQDLGTDDLDVSGG
jgi:tRNA-dihydrouridine synthase